MPKAQPKRPATSNRPADKPKSNSKDKAPPKRLPPSIINAAPTAVKILQLVGTAAKLIKQLEQEMTKAKDAGSIPLARAFVTLHRLHTRVDEELEPLADMFKRYKEQEVPATFEVDKITHVPLEEGFRVGLSSRLFASIPVGKRDHAFQWLRENGLGDLITATVNAGTLSAAAKTLMEEKNQELPAELFSVALVPNTSVTST
jgi:hypothetical protein